jgi:acetoin utilization protein AcuB
MRMSTLAKKYRAVAETAARVLYQPARRVRGVTAMATVKDFMTPLPVTIQEGDSIAQAHRLMRAKGIRHLPVVRAGRLVGVLSERDILMLETLSGVEAEQEPVEEAMTEMPYAVAPDALLEVVVREMALRKYGSAVVLDEGQVVGVFTTVDALKVLARMLEGKQPIP